MGDTEDVIDLSGPSVDNSQIHQRHTIPHEDNFIDLNDMAGHPAPQRLLKQPVLTLHHLVLRSVVDPTTDWLLELLIILRMISIWTTWMRTTQ